ncbi:MAG: hypothetical protein J6V92_01240 [Bacteroidaceae bacterium]|nr:hypothetical protein [Bacteroidaceae bacterium]
MKKYILTLLLGSFAIGATAQTENPRGIYKLMTLIGKSGEVNSPYHQYKVCTDSLTLMVVFGRNGTFQINNNDRMVFNYTGDQPKSEDDKSILIYDSNAEHFTEKWWSEYPYHIIFPHNDWCVEKYKSGEYTAESRIAFDAMTGKTEVDAKNPLTGTWRFIGELDELRDLKKGLAKLHERYPKSKYYNNFFIFTPKNLVFASSGSGIVGDVVYDGKKGYTYKYNDITRKVKWLSKDRIAVELHTEIGTDWQILERVTDGQTPMSHIISSYIQRSPRALH